MLWSFIVIGILCLSGQMVTDAFELISNELNQCKCYLVPLEMQRMLLILLANVQQSTFIRGYGNIYCTRETFKNVSNVFEHGIDL